MSERAFELNTKKLEQLIKALKDKPPSARIGILGNARQGKGPTNAEIGAAHEFGTKRLPMRSFLRIPIIDNIEKYLKSKGAFDVEALKKVLKKGNLSPWLRKIAAVAEEIVSDAFDTGGFGKWPPSDMTHKKNHQTLVETGQLRNFVTVEYVETD